MAVKRVDCFFWKSRTKPESSPSSPVACATRKSTLGGYGVIRTTWGTEESAASRKTVRSFSTAPKGLDSPPSNRTALHVSGPDKVGNRRGKSLMSSRRPASTSTP